MILHKINGYIQSIYLVEYPDKLMLLDGCSRADVSEVCLFITENLKRNLSDLKLIIVTHMHPDHAGGAHKLRKLTGAKIAAANVKGQWYQGIDGYFMHLTDMALTQWVAKRKGKPRKNILYARFLKPDILFDDNQEVTGFPDWRVIETQGHTDRDISLYHQPTSSIYVADLMVKVNNKLIPPFPIFYPNRYKRSLNKVMLLNPKTIILAHGNKQTLQQKDFHTLIAKAPTVPMTHWRSVKIKLKSVLFKSN